ncbi:MAG: DUF1592 domain-containing protein, partial [Planctomycetales bacterium]|nr:DUF1592 domain-containing protein [Planctomycetales bacterium]
MFFLPERLSVLRCGRSIIAAAVCFAISIRAVGDESVDSAEFQQQFDSVAVEFLDNYCTMCHSGDEPEAGFGLDATEKLRHVNQQRDAWLHAVAKIRGGEMPPEDEAQPSEKEAEAFLALIEGELARFDCSKNQKPGRVTVRRLNRTEYNNTIRDLTGIDFQPAKDFPADDVGVGFDNIGAVLSLPPLLMEKYLDAAESISEQSLEQQSFRDRWLPGDVVDRPQRDVARDALQKFSTAAFRRPLRDGELDSIMRLYDINIQQTGDAKQAAGFAMQGVLVSPNFLFRLEVEGPDDDLTTQRKLNDFELATRLSYFFWSSMPDQELFGVARSGKLHEPAELERQVRRMLADDKGSALVKNFAGQWLELRNLAKLAPDPGVYPDFDEQLRAAMIRE